MKIKKGDEVKFYEDGLFVHYGTVERVNKLTYGIKDSFGNYTRVIKKDVWWN